ncbi:MAG: 50S ribosomal protein L31, partial [Planctomycetes bacterium]|nr:50S ribosomal protein L31 [Planctomycetota bacterium]
TGKQKFVDTAGMVEKFQRKWKGEAAQKAQAIANPPPKKSAKLQTARSSQTIAATLGAPKQAAPPAPPAARAAAPPSPAPAAKPADSKPADPAAKKA